VLAAFRKASAGRVLIDGQPVFENRASPARSASSERPATPATRVSGSARVVRWFALGYGFYLVNRLLAVCVAHGRTRREFLRSVALYVVVGGAALGTLLTLGFALEAVLYRAMDWPHRVADERLFDAPTSTRSSS
jgi:hypothetical protein